MAVEKRGGPNGGPQYNQANVNPMGGDGQSGRMDLNYSGLPYGQNKATNEQRTAAPTKATTPTPPPRSSLGPVTPITAESSLPDQLITDMSGLSSLPQPDADPDIEQIRTMLPVLEFWASQPDSSQGTKDYVQYLRTIL
jgi:hypothetical protein